MKSIKISYDGASEYYLDGGSKIISRQMLGTTYIRNGACYCITPKALTTIKSFVGQHSKLIETEPMISIDRMDELKKCSNILEKRT